MITRKYTVEDFNYDTVIIKIIQAANWAADPWAPYDKCNILCRRPWFFICKPNEMWKDVRNQSGSEKVNLGNFNNMFGRKKNICYINENPK